MHYLIRVWAWGPGQQRLEYDEREKRARYAGRAMDEAEIREVHQAFSELVALLDESGKG